MPRRPKPQQLDLFEPPWTAEAVPTPQWKSLPDETRLTLTALMVRSILDDADDAASQHKEAGHDA